MGTSIPRLINLPRIVDQRGNLSFAEFPAQLPFKPERVYWIYDVPGDEARGGHAFKRNEEFIIAMSGAFDVVVDDGNEKTTFSLNRSYFGLYIPAGLWREINNFSSNALALEFGSQKYDPSDYIRDYNDYLNFVRNGTL